MGGGLACLDEPVRSLRRDQCDFPGTIRAVGGDHTVRAPQSSGDESVGEGSGKTAFPSSLAAAMSAERAY